ncbi:MAG: hydrogenase 4 subunit B [Bauldia sp.]|uniref:hydrogenase 4 subunit B n=1 Tax=Bauldia sp. TaxID=2575872 RepID=UPI001DDDAD67|nr:hydrogenase 4 subunit B [Bauldia sp.]MCB1496926.1 hydrogenase 4 subunit B [Bauldia sp.]
MTILLLSVVGLLVLGLVSIPAGHSPRMSAIVYGLSAAITAVLLAHALAHLVSGSGPVSQTMPLGLPWIGVHFRLDALSALFLAIVAAGGLAASVYGIGYGRHEESPGRVLPFFPAFLAGMVLVVLADDAFTFLVSWEFMSLASWALVMAHHREADNARSGYVYLIMAAFGTFCLLLAFGLLAGAQGSYAFSAMRGEALTPVTAGLVLALALVGAGSKAGLVPLHVWLPLAHPAAPSHVSALMSGVMTKVAIYAFIRIIFDLAGPIEWWWSVPLLVVGACTAVLGVLYATMQEDMKRVLAYSTIENIGMIFVGLGLALAFAANGFAAAAALAMTAALFHAINHSLFKSLLFFGAGAVLRATGERRMDALGGLIHRMPRTGIVFLVGCVAISALPPLNGFASEWLMLQAILQSPDLPEWVLKLSIPAVGAMLALATALAAACFVRIYGIVFLGRPRTAEAAAAREVDGYALTAMFALGGLCLAAGVLPGFVIDGLAPVVSGLVGARMPTQAGMEWLSIMPVAESRSSYNGLLGFLFIVFSASMAAFVIHRFASRAIRRAPAWDCGFPDPRPAAQYGASSFAQPIRRVFAAAIGAKETVDMPLPGDLRPARFSSVIRDRVWDLLYQPVVTGVAAAADRLNRFQFLTIRRYLSLVFVVLVGLLMVLALWQ